MRGRLHCCCVCHEIGRLTGEGECIIYHIYFKNVAQILESTFVLTTLSRYMWYMIYEVHASLLARRSSMLTHTHNSSLRQLPRNENLSLIMMSPWALPWPVAYDRAPSRLSTATANLSMHVSQEFSAPSNSDTFSPKGRRPYRVHA